MHMHMLHMHVYMYTHRVGERIAQRAARRLERGLRGPRLVRAAEQQDGVVVVVEEQDVRGARRHGRQHLPGEARGCKGM